MNVELSTTSGSSGSAGTTKQLLPLAGTQKTATVGADLKASISYTRTEAKLNVVGIMLLLSLLEQEIMQSRKVDLVSATHTKPKVGAKEVDVARTPETAYFNVTVKPKSATYAGTLVVTMKNGQKATPVVVPGSPFATADPFLVPISGTDFAAGKDTVIYSFKARTEGAIRMMWPIQFSPVILIST